MSTYRQRLGKKGEQLAEAYLAEKMYHIVGRNVRTNRGEIDLVAWDGGTLVFVEVKTRSTIRYGTPAEAITRHKQSKLRELALAYLNDWDGRVPAFRFDVICILVTGTEEQITHIRHAF